MNYDYDTLQPLIVSTPPHDSIPIQPGNSEPLRVVFRRPDKNPLAETTTPLDFGTIQQGNSKSLQVVIRNPNKQPVLCQTDNLQTKWLSLENNDGGYLQPDKPQEFKVTVDTSRLVAGSYTATVIFTANTDKSSASIHVPVLVTVSPVADPAMVKDPILTLSSLKTGLSFVQYLSSSQTLPLTINNWDSQNAIAWTADTGGTNWLRLDRTKGVLQPFELQTLWVTANTNSLNFGDYAATLTLNTEGTQPSTQIQVELHVDAVGDGDNGPKAPIVNPGQFNFNKPQTDVTQATLQVTNPSVQFPPYNVILTIENTVPTPPWLTWVIETPNIALRPSPQDPPRNVYLTINKTGLGPGIYTFDLLPTFQFAPPIPAGSHPNSTPVHITLTI
jgi:hypothetical protein